VGLFVFSHVFFFVLFFGSRNRSVHLFIDIDGENGL